jgi:hypothetical protein
VTQIGVDPGLSGAIAGINSESKEIEFAFPLPSLPIIKDGKTTGRNYFDIDGVLSLVEAIRRAHPECRAMIEELVPLPKIGGFSAMSMGKASMLIEVGLTAYGIKYDMVRPHVWKGYFELPKNNKSASVELVKKFYPQFNFAKHRRAEVRHGIADAILIARYALEMKK